ncbi:hypothetical protein D3C78_1387830 [compost metagenome]
MLQLACETWTAALAQQQAPVAVPDGWKLVPAEPTEKMLESDSVKCHCGYQFSADLFDHVYRQMIAAAPAEPVAQEPRLKNRTIAVKTNTISGAEAWTAGKHGVILYGTKEEAQADADESDRRRAKAMFEALNFTAPPAAEQPVCVSDQAKSETQANLSAIRETQAAEQPDMVKVPRDLLADMCSLDHDTRIQAERRLLALLAGGEA